MQHAKQQDVAKHVADLALPGESYSRLVADLREYARKMLDDGYPREALVEDFERARGVLAERGAHQDADDPILDVMDFLVGFCSPGAKL